MYLRNIKYSKNYVNLTKNSDQKYENHTHFEFMQIMHYLFIYLFMFLWNFEQVFGWGPERKSLWLKYIDEICVTDINYFPSSDFELTQFMKIIKRCYV